MTEEEIEARRVEIRSQLPRDATPLAAYQLGVITKAELGEENRRFFQKEPSLYFGDENYRQKATIVEITNGVIEQEPITSMDERFSEITPFPSPDIKSIVIDRSKSSERMWPTEMPARVTLNGVRYVQQTVRSYTPPERDEWLEKLHEMNNDDSTEIRDYQAHLRFGFEKGYI